MGPASLAAWQWEDYDRFHADRRNLLIHIVAVPAFVVGNVTIVAGAVLSLTAGLWWLPLVGIALTVGGIAAQGRGHDHEDHPPKPFTGAGNALGRIFVEQWFTFPRFVVTGGWRKALRTSK